MRQPPFLTLDEWLAAKPRVAVALSEGGYIAATIIELDGRVMLSELDWLHRMMPKVFVRVLPITEGWAYEPRTKDAR